MPGGVLRRASQRYNSPLTDCGSSIPQFSASLKALNSIIRLRKARSSRSATTLFFDDKDLVGDLPLELVTVDGGKLGASETASYSDTADADAGSSVKRWCVRIVLWHSDHPFHGYDGSAPRPLTFACPAPRRVVIVISNRRRPPRPPPGRPAHQVCICVFIFWTLGVSRLGVAVYFV